MLFEARWELIVAGVGADPDDAIGAVCPLPLYPSAVQTRCSGLSLVFAVSSHTLPVKGGPAFVGPVVDDLGMVRGVRNGSLSLMSSVVLRQAEFMAILVGLAERGLSRV